MFRLRYVLPLVSVLAAGTILYVKTCTAERQTIGDGVPASLRVSMDEGIDHAVWDGLLKKYVDGRGMVNYAAWKDSVADRGALKAYLASLSKADPKKNASRAGRLAFWINAYNALTVHGILEKYPTASIKDHVSYFGGYNIWKDLLLPVGDEKYSLHAMEHEVLRKMSEPRIHFAIVCASIGCPPLRNEAFVADTLEEQLDGQARTFLSDPTKFRIDRTGSTVHISSIFKWFGKDFVPKHGTDSFYAGHNTSQRAVLGFIAGYASPEDAKYLKTASYSIEYQDYDWSLNER